MGIFVALVKLIIQVPLFYLHQIIKKLCQNDGANCIHHQECGQQEAQDIRPSPTLVPVPYMSDYLSTLIKKKLPAILLGDMMGYQDSSGGYYCAICMSCIDKREEIRLLGSCRHLYHRECMDGWVERGHGTCPLCRLKLLPVEDEDVKDQKDPWREERIAYLFGEEHVHVSF